MPSKKRIPPVWVAAVGDQIELCTRDGKNRLGVIRELHPKRRIAVIEFYDNGRTKNVPITHLAYAPTHAEIYDTGCVEIRDRWREKQLIGRVV